MMVMLSQRSLFKWTLMCSMDSLTLLLVRMDWGQANRSIGWLRRKSLDGLIFCLGSLRTESHENFIFRCGRYRHRF